MRLKTTITTLALTGALVGGGAAVANAASSSSSGPASHSAPKTTQAPAGPQKGSGPRAGHNCPGMGKSSSGSSFKPGYSSAPNT
jgi:hypothetical protein